MSFPRYPKYKPSGVEWLGDVPEHWEASPLRSLARPGTNSFTDGDWIEAPFITDEGVRLLQTGNIGVGNFKEQGFRFISEQSFDDLGCSEVDPGDVLICRLAEPVGRACLAPSLDVRMITSVDVCILKTSEYVCPRFLVHLMSSAHYLGFMEGQCRGGTRDRVSRSFLAGVRLLLPPLPEQRAIASFLDRETAKIDALVAEQQRLIELLKEKRQAVISHAVTKGLDPKAPMKPSGVEWLGDVPAHWEVRPLRHLRCAVQTGPFGSQLHADEYIEGGIPVVNPINLVEGGILPTDSVTVSEQTARRLSHQRLRAGDIVFARRGELGRCAQVTNQEVGWLCGTGSMVLRLEDAGVETSYFARYLAIPAARHYFTLHCIGSVMPSLNTSTLLGLAILLPPVEEQRRIDAVCTELLGRLDRLVAEAESAMTLLWERRSALISAAVTGQIDVRNTVASEAA